MAKIGEGDARWIVKERDDGANVNSWHWVTKDMSAHVKDALNHALKHGDIFPSDGPLANVQIKSAETTGEASVNNRKGRSFLIYEFEIKLKWAGELLDAEGMAIESTSGSIKLPDVAPESLEDLECEFETKARGSTLSEAVRKQGVRCVTAAVRRTMAELQAEVTANAAKSKPAGAPSAVTPAVNVPLPQPIKVDGPTPPPPAPYAVKGANAAAAPASARRRVVEDDDDDELPPPKMREALKKLRDNPASTKHLRLSNLSIMDVHLRPLIEALQHSQVCLEELDLSFNRITDAGVHVLLQALATGTALELTTLYLGGNKTSVAGMALSQNLKQSRSDILVNWHLQLPRAKNLCTVGTVYPQSPAAQAGLRTGDSVVAFGPVQHEEYRGVSESIVPVVKASVGKPIDVVVVRIDDTSSQVQQAQLTLTPQKWSGAGLLGCILK